MMEERVMEEKVKVERILVEICGSEKRFVGV